jgi:hypothetical protein
MATENEILDVIPVTDTRTTDVADENRDPLTGEKGAHPVGTGVGAAVGGGATGAALGVVAGPVGVVAGAVVGGIVGGYAGKEVAESINPTFEEAYWAQNYHTRPYVQPGVAYEEYEPAYRYGWESRRRYPDKQFDEAEPELQRDWEKARAQSQLDWEKAKQATRDAWDRVEGHKTGPR